MIGTYTITPPVRVRAGSVGDVELFHPCADCGLDEPIASMLAMAPSIAAACLMGDADNGTLRFAYFCEPCTNARMLPIAVQYGHIPPGMVAEDG